jgi:uncharacterized membrane protein
MISNHYPMTYQHPYNWLVLILISVASAWIRHFFNLRHQGIFRPSVLITGMLGMLFIAGWISWPESKPATASAEATATQVPLNAQQQAVSELIESHCARCHSASPTDDIFVIAPMGLHLDNWKQIEQFAPRIYARTVQTKDMPLLNKTAMTEKERQVIADWYESRQK